jgi:hypothetical protein
MTNTKKTVKRAQREVVVHHVEDFCKSKSLTVYDWASTDEYEKITCVGCLASAMYRRNKKIMGWDDCLNRARVLIEAKRTVERARIE